MDDKPVKYSLLIKHPSPDLWNDEEYMKGKQRVNITAALTNLDFAHYKDGSVSVGVPDFIADLFRHAIHNGHLRVELLVGDTEYKLYVRPEAQPEGDKRESVLDEREAVFVYNPSRTFNTRNATAKDFLIKHDAKGRLVPIKIIEVIDGGSYAPPHPNYWRAIKTLMDEGYQLSHETGI